MKKFLKVLALAGLLVGSAIAQTTPTPVNYTEILTENLGSINTIWGTVATIMVGVALVTVGIRFFRKAK